MTNVINFAGIDVSKETFDAALIINLNKQDIRHQQFSNDEKGCKALQQWIKKQTQSADNTTAICMEHTGIYNWALVEFLSKTEMIIWLEMALQIKMSLGIQRGKTDKLDAIRIALFAYKEREDIKEWKPASAVVKNLHALMTSRERLLRAVNMLQVPINEFKAMGDIATAKLLEKANKTAIKQLEKALEKTEAQLTAELKKDSTIKHFYDLLTSVKGIAKVIATYLIVYTKGFTRLTNKKQLGSYTGVVPFKHESGKTVKRKDKTDRMTNATLRSAVAMGAKSAMNFDPELKDYAERKMKEGKDYGWCVTAVSNKLLARALSCVNNNKKYVIKQAA